MMRWTNVWVAALAAAMAAACGGSSGSGGSAGSGGAGGAGGSAGGDGGVTCAPGHADTDFATGYAKAACDNMATCCSSGGMSFDAAGCVASVESAIQTFVDQAVCGGSTYVAGNAQACFDAVAAYAKTCTGDPVLYHVANAACNRAFQGPHQPGEPCTSSLDCAQPTTGDATCLTWSDSGSDGGMTSGVECQSRPIAKVGEACGNFGHDPVEPRCDEAAGEYCVAGTCKPSVAVGGACTYQDHCMDGAVCSGGVCTQGAPVGSACGANAPCVAEAHCDNSGTCVGEAKIGDPCTSSLDCATATCGGGRCMPQNTIVSFFGKTSCY